MPQIFLHDLMLPEYILHFFSLLWSLILIGRIWYGTQLVVDLQHQVHLVVNCFALNQNPLFFNTFCGIMVYLSIFVLGEKPYLDLCITTTCCC